MSGSGAPKPGGKSNHNVVLMLILCGILGAAESLWTGTVLAAMVYLISGNSNAVVGYIEAAYGLAVLASAFPVGYAADKYGRSRVIVLGGVLCMIAAGVTSAAGYFAVEEAVDDSGRTKDWPIWMLGGCMAVWGISSGIASGPAQALYADSIPQGERSKWYTALMGVYLLASVTGPALAIGLFQVYGDRWHPMELRNVLWAGMAFEFLAAIPMYFFDDKKALTEPDDEEDDEEDGSTKDSGVPVSGPINSPKKNSSRIKSEKKTWLGFRKAHIPWVLFANDVVVAMGSGMTVKFFPLFFKETCKYSPSQVQGIYVAVPLSIALLSGVGTVLSKYIGRVPTIICLRYIGICLMLTMAYGEHKLKPIILAVVYVVRTGFMNSTYPLEESILMDSVPKSSRARWKSMESITQFGWCGSAVLGGILCDHYSYGFTFVITAIVQGTGTLLLILIHPLIPHEKSKGRDEDKIKKQSNGSTVEGHKLARGPNAGKEENAPLLVYV